MFICADLLLIPTHEDRVKTVGQAISSGKSYGKPHSIWHVACVGNQFVQILKTGSCPDGTLHGVSKSA